jgi:hypothetical protein
MGLKEKAYLETADWICMFRIEASDCFSEHDNKSSVSIKYWEFIEQMSYYQLEKRACPVQ